MKVNEGPVDRIVRVIIGLAIIGVGVYLKSWWGLVGLIPLATGIAGRCCLYGVFHLNTCKIEPAVTAEKPKQE